MNFSSVCSLSSSVYHGKFWNIFKNHLRIYKNKERAAASVDLIWHYARSLRRFIQTLRQSGGVAALIVHSNKTLESKKSAPAQNRNQRIKKARMLFIISFYRSALGKEKSWLGAEQRYAGINTEESVKELAYSYMTERDTQRQILLERLCSDETRQQRQWRCRRGHGNPTSAAVMMVIEIQRGFY